MHHAKFAATNEEIIILGYNAQTGVLACFYKNLPEMERNNLLSLVDSSEAQSVNYLAEYLNRIQHPTVGKDWFSYFINDHLKKNSKAVRNISIIDTAFDNGQQSKIFRGEKVTNKNPVNVLQNSTGNVDDVVAKVTSTVMAFFSEKIVLLEERIETLENALKSSTDSVDTTIVPTKATRGRTKKAA